MNHVLKIDERAFNKGVKDLLKLRPLVQAIKVSVGQEHSTKTPKPKDAKHVVCK